MNKSELISKMAASAGITKVQAQKALNEFMDSTKAALKKGGKVTLVGFGTYSVAKRAARTGRNPQTSAPIKIKASKVAKFKPGKSLRDAIK